MTSRPLWATAVLFAVATPHTLAAQAPARAAIDRVAWLTGCWVADGSRHVVEEHWMRPAGGSMLGMARTVTGEKTTGFEFVRIVEEEGTLAYHANPSGQAAARFVADSSSDSLVSFFDAEHDFPQRVAYRLQADGSLLAWIEGTINGRSRRQEFPYRPVECR